MVTFRAAFPKSHTFGLISGMCQAVLYFCWLWTDYVRHGEIKDKYLVFVKAHGPVFYHL